MNYTYIVKCADGTFYTGWTTDIYRRVKCHNDGKGAKYTRPRLPVELVYQEEVADRSAALRREAAIKRLSRKEKLSLLEETDPKERQLENSG